ncbi:MAG: histidine kinase [Acidobacteriales bacterium]|nr:histidine kinase [Terriglobales bacterium]
MEQRLILINLLIKLGVAAAVASALVRSVEFKRLLFSEERSLREKIYLVLWIASPLAVGVWIRFSTKTFFAGDLSLETAMLLGVLGGRFTGALGGAVVGMPALLHGEWATLPFTMLCGLVAGQMHELAPDQEEVWSFSPFIDFSISRWVRRNLPRPRLFDWQIIFFFSIVAMRFLHTQLSRLLPTATFSLESPNIWVEIAIYACSVMVIGIQLKIWNSVRIQIKLEEQEKLLLHARMEALQNQINPHFLFNTLNSISSLVRFAPDTARELIIKLANILRRLLNSSDSFVPLREELAFIDDYLDIEVVRFGRDKLQVIKQLDPASLDVMVPAMLLQPLVENSIKHGLSSKIEGGSIFLRSKVTRSKLTIEVEDDGVGMPVTPPERDLRTDSATRTGIGMANVAERLKVLYGTTARISVESEPGKGTRVRIRLPLLQAEGTIPDTLYEERSTMRR